MNKKVYEIVDYPEKGMSYGKYMSRSPNRAAKKILSFLARLVNINNNKNMKTRLIVFVIRDIKSGKEFKFVGTRIRLNKPSVVYFGKKKVLYNFKNVVTKYEKYYNSK